MNEIAILMASSIRVLMYFFVAISLVFLAISYQNWPRNIVAWIHLAAALIFSIIGTMVFLEVAGFVDISVFIKNVILTPMLVGVGVTVWYWLINRERKRVKRVEEGGSIFSKPRDISSHNDQI